MTNLDAHERLRRAAELLAANRDRSSDTALLFEAWEYLKSFRSDDLPAEIRAPFSFLEREMERAKCEEPTAREVAFLTEKIRKLESMWIDNAHKSMDTSAQLS